jgi:hypothetical protein
MKTNLDVTLSQLAEALRPYRATVELVASTPYDGMPWLRITVASVEFREPALEAARRIVANCERELGVDVFAPLDGRVRISIWERIGYFEGLRLLTGLLDAIVAHMPPDAPRDINGFAIWHTDHSTDVVFGLRSAMQATEADYARDAALRGERRYSSDVRARVAEWYANRSWSGDYVYGLEQWRRWLAWTERARTLLDPLYREHADPGAMYGEWMAAICAQALRSVLPRFRALPNVTDDFIAILDQGDVDEHQRLFDLARTLGFERAAALCPLRPLAPLH